MHMTEASTGFTPAPMEGHGVYNHSSRVQATALSSAVPLLSRAANAFANVQATVMLSQSDTSEGLKQAIEGRIRALANVHSLFVQTRWIGADLTTIATQELVSTKS
jgi:ribosomal protein S2